MHASRSGLGVRVGAGLVDVALAHVWVALALAGLVVGMGAGCDSSAAIPIEELPARVEASYCQRAASCAGGPDVTSCEASLSIEQDRNLNMLVAAVKRGTAIYDGARAKECLDAFAASCVDERDPPPACDETFRGAVAAGGTCQVSEECISGSCVRPCGDACCAGTCGPGPAKVPVGGDCSNAGICVAGAYCKNGRCATSLPISAACTASDVCSSPGRCAIANGSTGTCVAAPDEGAPCSDVQPCSRADNYCDPATLVCTKHKAAGAACNEAGSECPAFAPCRNGACTPLPTLGQPCDLRCFGDLICAQGACVAGPGPTNTCTP